MRSSGARRKPISRQSVRRFRSPGYQILDGHPAEALHYHARENADIVVVGNHGRHGIRALFASTPNQILHGTSCDVLAVRVADQGTEEVAGYKRILAAVDLSDDSFAVMEQASRLATYSGAELAICHVCHTVTQQAEADAADRLDHLADTYGLEEDAFYTLAGNAVPEVHALARRLGADLVVVGTHGKRGLQLLTGSMSNAMLHSCSCDALTVRIHQPEVARRHAAQI